jgi:hypothetical protein
MSQASSRAILVGADLIVALAKTRDQIKWVRKTPDGVEVIPIPPAMAILSRVPAITRARPITATSF